MCPLPKILELKKKYKFYQFVDEAHSIGALGPHGRGVCDFFGVDPRSVDVLMGTFTKSFGATGGYIAGSQEFIDKLRIKSHSAAYAETISPPVLGQILASLSSIMGIDFPSELPGGSPSLQHRTFSSSSSVATITAGSQLTRFTPSRLPSNLLPTWLLSSLPPSFLSGAEGSTRIRRLAFNSRYLHLALIKLGFLTYGHPASPIVPLMLFQPGKMAIFSQMMLQRRTRIYGSSVSTASKPGVGIPIVVVVVSYPATTLTTARVRFCMSASHTKEDVDMLLEAIDEVGTILGLKMAARKDSWTVEQCKQRALELVEHGC